MSERTLHLAALDYLRTVAPEVMVVHVANEGKRGFQAQRDFKQLGCVSGFPDLLLIFSGKCAWIELKSMRGRLSPAQKDCHAQLRAHAIPGITARSLEDIELFLLSLGIAMRGRLAA